MFSDMNIYKKYMHNLLGHTDTRTRSEVPVAATTLRMSAIKNRNENDLICTKDQILIQFSQIIDLSVLRYHCWLYSINLVSILPNV